MHSKRISLPAKKQLVEAEEKARLGDVRAFYGTVAAALKLEVERRLGEAIGGLTHDRLRHELRERGLDENIVRRLIEELEGCDFARFSSAGGSEVEMSQTLSRARSLLKELDSFRPQGAV